MPARITWPRPWLVLTALVAVSAACTHTPSADAPLDAAARWRRTRDYYALYELVDRHIDPQWHKNVSKADVLTYLGEGIHDPDLYPNAGPDLWVYTSDKPRSEGSYLSISFDKNGFVKGIDWASE